MRLVIMQPYFFPYIGYFQLIDAANEFVFYDDVNYIKGGWVNRNRILVNKRNVGYLNASLVQASPNKLIKDIRLAEAELWRKKAIKSVRFSYAKAPMFGDVLPLMEDIINYDTNFLAELNCYCVSKISEYLDLECTFSKSSEIPKMYDQSAQDKVLYMCQLKGCTTYINAINGVGLYSNESFQEEHIDLRFLKANSNLSYSQFMDPFVPNLSIIDVLMFNSVDQTKNLLKQYTLIENVNG